jgi:hypothetical protein
MSTNNTEDTGVHSEIAVPYYSTRDIMSPGHGANLRKGLFSVKNDLAYYGAMCFKEDSEGYVDTTDNHLGGHVCVFIKKKDPS